jgi:hypothetical protein
MALADYFHRSAVAAAQVLSGFDEEAIRVRLKGLSVGISYGEEAVASAEGRHCTEMAVRLLARLYPQLQIVGPGDGEWEELATRINPNLDLVSGGCDLSLRIGEGAPAISTLGFCLGSDGWDARFSTRLEQKLGNSRNPLGAGAAACLGAAAIFRSVFLDEAVDDGDLVLSTLELGTALSDEQPSLERLEIPPATVLVGLGAVGNAALWAIARSGCGGHLHLVDPEAIDSGNLQRYVMAAPTDVHRPKAELAAEVLGDGLGPDPYAEPWADFLGDAGRRWERVLVALDSAGDRRAIQASLPRWIANAWTQPGDLGVSVHPWREGACLACLYMPGEDLPSEDQLVASAMGFEDEVHLRQIRSLLVTGGSPSPELLAEAATALGIDVEPLMPYAARPLRELYVEGICGGAAVPLDRLGLPERAVHVPLAHQSALAGILLVSRLYADLLGVGPHSAQATRIDLMRRLPASLTQPIAKDSRGLCICQDAVYQAAYEEKWPATGVGAQIAV